MRLSDFCAVIRRAALRIRNILDVFRRAALRIISGLMALAFYRQMEFRMSFCNRGICIVFT